jgi:predicted phosphodiesterase
MLILIVGDTHFSGKNPIARLDDIVDAQYNKLTQIINLSNKYDAPIVHTGDIFNVAVISNRILTRIGKALNRLKHPLYFVWGNHDLMYHTLELWDRTSLGVLWKSCNKVEHISGFQSRYKDVRWAWYDWDDDIQWNTCDKPDLLLTHKAVVSEKRMGKGSWVVKDEDFCMNIDDYYLKSDTNSLEGYRLIVCGHWHKPYMFKHKDAMIINPGPVLRRTVEEWLMPSVILLNTDTLLYKRLYLEAEPPNKVLSRKHIEQRIDSYTEGVMKFVNKLKDKKVSGKKKFLENLFEMLDSHELPKEVETLLRNTIVNLIEKGELNESL